MAHEELKMQYEEDCKNYERPWELWEISSDVRNWISCTCTPSWSQWSEYRRKEPPFQPEYFSGLNWRDAEKLIGKVVEASRNGDEWICTRLVQLNSDPRVYPKFHTEKGSYYYICTTPQPVKRPTITIAGGWKLPKPEVETPEKNTHYFFLRENTEVLTGVWWGSYADYKRLTSHRLHLTESRAQEWASWWSESVISAIKGHGGHTNGD